MTENIVKVLGFMDNGTGQHQSNTVYDSRYICPTITTVNGGGTQQIKILEIDDRVQVPEVRENRICEEDSQTI